MKKNEFFLIISLYKYTAHYYAGVFVQIPKNENKTLKMEWVFTAAFLLAQNSGIYRQVCGC